RAPRRPRARHSFPTRRSSDLTAGIAVGAFGLSVMYGAAMFIVARRYKRKRQAHRRSSSITGSEASSEMQYARNGSPAMMGGALRSEEHTSELQSRENLVCRLL